MSQVFLTGANGFVGLKLAAELISRGHTVRALVRRPNAELDALGVDVILGELHTIDATTVADCDAIVHGAASFSADLAEGRAVNRDATDLLARLAHDNGAYYVLVSTSAVYNTDLATGHVIDEDAPRRDLDSMGGPTGSSSPVYGFTKAEGEILTEQARERGLLTAILRPSSVLGVGPTSTWGTKIPDRLKGGEVIRRNPNGSFAWLHVDDLVDGIIAAIDQKANITANLVTGHEPYRNYFNAIVEAVPGAIDIARITPDSYDPAWTGEYSNQRAKQLLGWTPRYAFDAAMDEIQQDLIRRWA